MDNAAFNFQLVDVLKADIVVSNALKTIEESTRGYVVGQVKAYDGNIKTYTKEQLNPIASMMDMVGPRKETITVDIQESLGGQNKSYYKFEVYLSVKGLEYYKYRIMFLGYGDIAYPVTVVLASEFTELFGKHQDVFLVESMRQVEMMINTVINSDIMTKLIQSLIYESLRREKESVEEAKKMDEDNHHVGD